MCRLCGFDGDEHDEANIKASTCGVLGSYRTSVKYSHLQECTKGTDTLRTKYNSNGFLVGGPQSMSARMPKLSNLFVSCFLV